MSPELSRRDCTVCGQTHTVFWLLRNNISVESNNYIFVESNKVFIFHEQALDLLCLFPANHEALKSIHTA